ASETIAALRASPEAARLKLSQCPVVPTLEDLLDTVDFDVAVLSSQGDKERVTSALLAKQKYVLLEPPLALSMEAALRLTKQSRQSQPSVQRVLVSEPIEYWPELHRASDLLSRDTVGSVFAAQGLGTSSGPEALSVLSEGIGCILAPGLSWIRALRRLLGPVEEVACMELVAAPSGAAEAQGLERTPSSSSNGGRSQIPRSWLARRDLGPETIATCLLRHTGGVVSTLRLQSNAPVLQHRQPQIVVSGLRGDVVVEDSDLRVNKETSAADTSPAFSPS
ncbi:unnamed protein product, partial [Polarella glacialis]